MEKRKLLLATTNKSKIKPFVAAWAKSVLKDYYDLILPTEFAEWRDLDVEEDTGSFELDALKKAKAYAKEFGITCVSLDRGFEFPALDRWPGTNTKKALAGDDKRVFEEETYYQTQLETRDLDIKRTQIVLDQIKDKDRTVNVVYGIAAAIGEDSINELITVSGKATDRLFIEGRGYYFDWFFIPDGLGLDRPISMLSEEEYMKIASEILWPIPEKVEQFLINKL
jgi:inosine/xanthosine triphosphate pyrophosphatase family protein